MRRNIFKNNYQKLEFQKKRKKLKKVLHVEVLFDMLEVVLKQLPA